MLYRWIFLVSLGWTLLILGLLGLGTVPGALLQAAALTAFLKSFKYIPADRLPAWWPRREQP